MRLLDAFRRRPDDAGTTAGPAGVETLTPAPTVQEEPPLSLESITPAWKKLPPLQPVLPPMPLSFGFDKDAVPLARGPALFLEDLGHLISAEAPSGLVEGIALLVPEAVGPPSEAAPSGHPWDETPASSDLPLSPPRARPGQPEPAAARTVMRMPDSSLPVVGPLSPVTAEPGRPVLAEAEVEGPGSDDPIQAAVVPSLPETTPAARPAPIPADLPLLPMPSFPVPEELKFNAPPAPVEVAGLVGVDPLTPPESHEMTRLSDTEQEAVGSSGQDGDLPLAQDPSTGPAATGPTTVMRLDDPRRAPVSPEDPPVPGAGTPATTVGRSDPGAAARPDNSALRTSVVPGSPPPASEASVVAPLVGQGEPVAAPADPTVLDPGPPAADEIPLDGAAPLPLAPRVPPEAVAPVGRPMTVFGPDAFATPEFAFDAADLAPTVAPGDSDGQGADWSAPVDPSTAGSGAENGPVPDGSAVAPLVGAEDRMAVGPTPEAMPPTDDSRGSPTPDLVVGLGSNARPRAGLGEPMSGLPSTARSYDLTRMTMTERRAMQLSMMQAELDRQTARNSGFGLALPRAGMRRVPAPPRAAFVDASNPVPSLPGPSSIAGTLPDGLPEPTASIAELVAFRAMGETVENREVPEVDEAEQGRVAVGRLYGLDLDVKIDRTPRTTLEAHHAGARAFTTASGISIPPEAGPLNSGPGEALLVHELTHVAQRQRSGGVVPDESSEEGRRVEAEALRNEHYFAATRTLPVTPLPAETPRPPSLPVARPLFPTMPSFATGTSSGADPADTPGGPHDGLPLAGSGGVDVSAIADSVAAMVTERISAAPPPSLPGEPAMAMQRAEEGTAPAPEPQVPESIEPPQNKDMERPPDADLDRLSSWLYPLIRFRLRKELREDRERAGLLTDLYRRW